MPAVLKPLCVSSALVRSNYYSDTYRANFKVGGVQKDWDITHISIPFSPERETAFQARFGVSAEEMQGFYASFAACVVHEINLLKHLHGQEAEKGLPLIRYFYTEKEAKPERGSDLYLVTEPMSPLLGSPFFSEEENSLENILQIGARLLQMCKQFAPMGLYVGSFDPDTILLTADDKPMMVLGSMLYAKRSEEGGLTFPPAGLTTTCEKKLQGLNQSSATDVFAVSALLWKLLSGQSHRDKLDLDVIPQYAPEGFLDLLKQGMSLSGDEATIKKLHSGIHKYIRSVRHGEIENVMIPMRKTDTAPAPAAKPETAETPGDVGPMQEEPVSQTEQKAEEPPAAVITPIHTVHSAAEQTQPKPEREKRAGKKRQAGAEEEDYEYELTDEEEVIPPSDSKEIVMQQNTPKVKMPKGPEQQRQERVQKAKNIYTEPVSTRQSSNIPAVIIMILLLALLVFAVYVTRFRPDILMNMKNWAHGVRLNINYKLSEFFHFANYPKFANPSLWRG